MEQRNRFGHKLGHFVALVNQIFNIIIIVEILLCIVGSLVVAVYIRGKFALNRGQMMSDYICYQIRCHSALEIKENRKRKYKCMNPSATTECVIQYKVCPTRGKCKISTLKTHHAFISSWYKITQTLFEWTLTLPHNITVWHIKIYSSCFLHFSAEGLKKMRHLCLSDMPPSHTF